MPGENFGATFGTVRGRNPGAGSKLHISRIVVASILLFGGVELRVVSRTDRRRAHCHQSC